MNNDEFIAELADIGQMYGDITTLKASAGEDPPFEKSMEIRAATGKCLDRVLAILPQMLDALDGALFETGDKRRLDKLEEAAGTIYNIEPPSEDIDLWGIWPTEDDPAFIPVLEKTLRGAIDRLWLN